MGGPDSLTDGAWDSLLPELTRLLGLNRTGRAQEAKDKQILRKHRYIEDRITYLKRTTHPFTQIINAVGIDFSHPLETFPQPFGESCALLRNPFPDFYLMIFWEHFNDMRTGDLDNLELDRLFTERQAQIEGAVKEWRDTLERQLVKKFQTQAEEHTEVLLTVCVSVFVSAKPSHANLYKVKGSSDLTAHLSSNTRFLLRADTVFREPLCGSAAVPEACFYPGLPCGADLEYISLHGYGKPRLCSQDLSMNPHDYDQHTGAQAVAKSILKEMHMPDATHFELIAMGKRFACGRCHERDHTWITIVRYFLLRVTPCQTSRK
ncbi:hypothetical protein FRC10_009235 [Ceratobasidium sp. 414]|nr:hypothetical protein FRC10_009235 [Ceratobasidium sp. 414]